MYLALLFISCPQEMNSLEPHDNFRLWLTAETHPKFPTILLQSSLKVTYEVCGIMGVQLRILKFSSGSSGISQIFIYRECVTEVCEAERNWRVKPS